MDLPTLPLGELQKLKSKIEKEIEGRYKKKRRQAMDEIKPIVAKYGLNFEDVIARPAAPKRSDDCSQENGQIQKARCHSLPSSG